MIYCGTTAKEILLGNNTQNGFKGYFLDEKKWVAFDNNSGDCWVEEFNNEEMAICWLEDLYEISEINNFEVVKIEKGLYYIPQSGFIRIEYQGNVAKTRCFKI